MGLDDARHWLQITVFYNKEGWMIQKVFGYNCRKPWLQFKSLAPQVILFNKVDAICKPEIKQATNYFVRETFCCLLLFFVTFSFPICVLARFLD